MDDVLFFEHFGNEAKSEKVRVQLAFVLSIYESKKEVG